MSRNVMPEIGEVKSAKELGYRSSCSSYVFQPCPCCGVPRWVRRTKAYKLCVKCARHEYLESRSSGALERLVQNGQAKLGANGIVLHQHFCRVCGKELWHQKRDIDRTCSLECARTIRAKWEESPKWRGGKRMSKGYIEVIIKPDNPYFSMASKNHYVREHRLVMAQHLGRCLESWEIVHHKNSDKLDNRLENLELLPNQSSHRPSIAVQRQLTSLGAKVASLEQENQKLKADLDLLKWHIKDIRHDIDNTEPSRSSCKGTLGVCRDYGLSIPRDGDNDIVRTSRKRE